jgi:hypothetical protein
LIFLFADFSRKDSMFSITCDGVSAQRFVFREERPDRRLGRAMDGWLFLISWPRFLFDLAGIVFGNLMMGRPLGWVDICEFYVISVFFFPFSHFVFGFFFFFPSLPFTSDELDYTPFQP